MIESWQCEGYIMKIKQRKTKELSIRHRNAIQYAVTVIRNSELQPYVEDVILYGSCARKEQNYSSDIDLLLVLSEEFRKNENLRIPLRKLKSQIMTDDIEDPEIDLKIVIGSDWKMNPMQYYKNVKKDGISLWIKS